MFSKAVKIAAISLCCTNAAMADADDWGFRHHSHHHYGYAYNPYYGGGVYAPPVMGYYSPPQQFYAPPPVNFYGYAQPAPRHGRYFREREHW